MSNKIKSLVKLSTSFSSINLKLGILFFVTFYPIQKYKLERSGQQTTELIVENRLDTSNILNSSCLPITNKSCALNNLTILIVITFGTFLLIRTKNYKNEIFN